MCLFMLITAFDYCMDYGCPVYVDNCLCEMPVDIYWFLLLVDRYIFITIALFSFFPFLVFLYILLLGLFFFCTKPLFLSVCIFLC